MFITLNSIPKKQSLIYVDQGQCSTINSNSYLLITTGMTECIGMAIQSRRNPKLKALIHCDGDVLCSKKFAELNIKSLKKQLDAFEKQDEFDIIAFGGKENEHNHSHLQSAIYSVFVNTKSSSSITLTKALNP